MPLTKIIIEALSDSEKSTIRDMIHTELETEMPKKFKMLDDKEFQKLVTNIVSEMLEEYHKIL